MALTLRDSMAPALQLRDQPSIVDQGLAFEQYQADDSNPVLRGWRSAGLGSEANSLFSDANAAERRGDMLAAQAYEQQAQDSLRRSQVWAPTTQEFTRIDGLRSAGSWLGGQVGNLRTSVPPLVGGVVGGLGGAALGSMVAGPGGAALGGRIGAGLGAGAMGYSMEYDESVGNAMMDPQIRATRSADDIHNASMVKGVVAGALESVVPAGVAKAAVLGVGKKVAGESLKKGIAKAAAIDAAQEAMTEAAQELTGQSTQNYLRGEDLTNWDAEQAFNAAMGGAVGGAVMGAGGQAAGTARDYLANREPKESRDLLGRGIDAFIKRSEKKGREEAQSEIAGMDDEAVLNKLFAKRAPHITDPISDEESKLSDEEIGKSRRALAEQHALEVVKAPSGMYPAEEVQAANEFLTGKAKDWMNMRDVSRTSRADKKAQDDAAALMKAAGLKEEKNSLMSPTLTDDEGITPDEQGSVLGRVTRLQKSLDKGAGEDQVSRTVTLADVLVNGGYWPKDIVDSAKTTTQKEGQLTTAATLLTWLKYGMMRDRKVKGGDTENVIEHLVGRYGKSGVDMLSKAYEVGVNAGLFERNDEMFEERRVEAEKLLADEKNHGDLIMGNLSPEFKREVRTKQDLAHLVREVRRMAGTVGAQANPEHSTKLRNATDTASPSRVDQRVLERLFPNAENRHKVLAALYSPSNSEFGSESKASQPVKETDGTGRTAKSFEVDEHSSMEAKEDEDDTAPSTTQKVEYLNRKKGHAYSKKDPEHRAQLAKDRKEAHADGYRVEEIGAVERALEVARRSKGEALSEQEKFSVIEKEVRKHTRKGLERPTEPPANASDVTKRLYTDELNRYKQRVQRAARGVDSRFVYLKRTETTDAPMSTELDLEAILSNERDVKIDDPRNGIGNGTMWFKKKTGGTFIINAPQITRLMFQRTENDGGLNHTVGTGEEKRELTKGGPQNVLELFHEGVASILAHDLFTGEFGYVHGGKAIEVSGNAKFPAEFKLSKSVTYGQGSTSQKLFADQIEGNEFDTEEMSQPTHRMQATMWQKFLALKAFAKKGENVSPELLTRLRKFVANVQANIDDNRKKGAKGDDLISRRNHIFLGKWMAALDIRAGTVNVAEAGVEQSRAKDGLQAYDPEKAIVRDNRNGMAETGDNIEMAAASLIGRSKRGTAPVAERKVGEKIVDTPIVERVEDQGGVPTAKTPGRTSSGLTDTQLEAGKQRFVELMRESVDAVVSAIKSMPPKELELFKTAVQDFTKLSSSNVTTLAKGYFKGDENAARMFTTRLSRSNVSLQDAIATRKEEFENGQVAESAEGAFGEGRQADTGREEARVASKSGRVGPTENSGNGARNTQWAADRSVERGLIKKKGDVDGLETSNQERQRGNIAQAGVQVRNSRGGGPVSQAASGLGKTSGNVAGGNGQQLQAYLDANAGKNRVWESVARKALSDSNEKQIAGALAAAKKQFGSPPKSFAKGWAEPSERQLKVLGEHFSQLKQAIAEAVPKPLQLNAFNKLAKYLSEFNIDLENYRDNSKEEIRSFSEGVVKFLEQLGLPVQGATVMLAEHPHEGGEADGWHVYSPSVSDKDVLLVSRATFDRITNSQDPNEQFRGLTTVVHEAAHALDAVGHDTDGRPFYASSSSQNFTPSTDKFRLANYAMNAAGNDSEWGEHFRYPAEEFMDGSPPERHRSEFFAQLYTVHLLDPVWTEKHANSFFTLAERIQNAKTQSEFINTISPGAEAGAPEWLSFRERGSNWSGVDSAQQRRMDLRGGVAISPSPEQEGGVKSSKKAPKGKVSTPEEQAAVAEQLHKLLGKDVKILFENLGGKSGSWTREQTMNVIRIAINADITSTGFHESMHQLLDLLKQGDGAKVVEQLQRAAMSPIMQQRLRTMLKDHPKAMSQLADPEEAVSYMFQFWMMDPSGFKIGPETRTLFEHFKDFLRSVAALFSKTIRTQLLTEKASRIEAETTLRVLNDLAAGKMADQTQRPSAIKVMAEYTGKRDEAVKNLGEGYKQLLQGFGKYLATNEGLLESYNNRHLTRLARLFNQRAGEARREGASFFDERDFRINKMMNKWEKVAQKYSKDDLEIARAWMSTEQGQAHPDAGINAIVADVKGILNEMKAYIAERDIKRLEPNPVTGKMEWKSIDFRKHYWPRIWDAELVDANKEEILEKLLAYTEVENIAKAATEEALKQGKPEVTKQDVALQIFSRMLGGTSQVELSEELSDLGMTPVATAVNRRSLEWLNMREFDKYVSKDMNNIMSAYIRNIIKRGEYQIRFGPGGELLKELVDSAILTELGGEKLMNEAVASLEMAQKNWGVAKAAAEAAGKKFDKEYPTTRSVGLAIYRSQHGDKAAEKIDATMKRLEPAFQAIMALEGTLGSDIDPTLRNVSSWVTTYQNYRLLVPGIFSSFMDVMGVVREGGELSDAWGAFVAGIKEIRNTWANEKDRDYMMERAELFGSADAGSYASTIGEANGSVYMSEGARKWSDRLFKWNGMEGWNRGMRAYATSVAERILLDWQKNGIDTKDKAAVARVERLFGKGFDVKNIAVEADGTLDIKDARNIAAVNRWVLDAVIRPNAAHRPVMASDPHMQVFYHLKNFTYSMHAVMLKNVAAQARLGNYRPAMVTLLGYAPIAIAAGAVKELLIPGDEPPWLKNGLVGYLDYGWDRAGVLGIPQMYASNLFDPAQNFGPSAGQLQDLITVPFGEFQVGPAGWRDHRVFEEMLGAAPFGTVLKRIGKNVDDIIEGK